MFRLYKWTLAAFLVLASLPSPSPAQNEPFCPDLKVRPQEVEITSASHIRAGFGNNRQTHKIRLLLWHEQQRQAPLRKPDASGPRPYERP
jgi:hypothetical protein